MERISVSGSAREALQSSARQAQARGLRPDRVQVGQTIERADMEQSSVRISGRAREVSRISGGQSRPEAAEALLAMIRSAGAQKTESVAPMRAELAVRRPETALSRTEPAANRTELPTGRRISIYV